MWHFQRIGVSIANFPSVESKTTNLERAMLAKVESAREWVEAQTNFTAWLVYPGSDSCANSSS